MYIYRRENPYPDLAQLVVATDCSGSSSLKAYKCSYLWVIGSTPIIRNTFPVRPQFFDKIELLLSKDIYTNHSKMIETEEISKMNKGTGAGGANTNLSGKKFEEETNNESRLLERGFTKISFTSASKNAYYLSKILEDKTAVFMIQSNLKKYIKQKYDITLFRCPDEAYIIEPNDASQPRIIQILEKKAQNGDGSVETKLWSGPSLKREYEIVLGHRFIVHYGFCLSSFLQKKIQSGENKYTILSQILGESNIPVLFGDEADYFDKLDMWTNDFV